MHAECHHQAFHAHLHSTSTCQNVLRVQTCNHPDHTRSSTRRSTIFPKQGLPLQNCIPTPIQKDEDGKSTGSKRSQKTKITIRSRGGAPSSKWIRIPERRESWRCSPRGSLARPLFLLCRQSLGKGETLEGHQRQGQRGRLPYLLRGFTRPDPFSAKTLSKITETVVKRTNPAEDFSCSSFFPPSNLLMSSLREAIWRNYSGPRQIRWDFAMW